MKIAEEMTDAERSAREFCVEQGMDPDFVGTKGYPNWQDYTPVQRAKIRELVAKTQQLLGIKL